MNDILKVIDLHKSYPLPNGEFLPVLNGINLNIEEQSTISIVGVSGSGKSTLLHLLGSLDSPTKGEIYYNDVLLNDYNDEQLSELRNRSFGFIFQFHYLISELTVLENVTLPHIIKDNTENIEYAKALLNEVGVYERKDYYPAQLSGGELQRVAIARALINNPKIIFADEPTGELDNNNAIIVFDLLLQMVQKHKSTLILVTHNNEFAEKLAINYRLHFGKLEKK